MLHVKEIQVKRGDKIKVMTEIYSRDTQADDVISFNPKGTATVFMKDGTVIVTYPGSFAFIRDRYSHIVAGAVPETPEFASTRDFYVEEAKVIHFDYSANNYCVLTGTFASDQPIRKYSDDFPSAFRVFTAEGKYADITTTNINRIEVDPLFTPVLETGETATITLQDGKVYTVPVSSLELNAVGSILGTGQPFWYYTPSFPVMRDPDEGKETVYFADVKRIEFTPELRTKDNDCTGIITYKNGTVEHAKFAFGVYYYREALRFYADIGHSFAMGNTSGGGHLAKFESISEIKSIEFN